VTRILTIAYGYKGAVIVKKLEMPDIQKKLQALYRRIDRRIARECSISTCKN